MPLEFGLVIRSRQELDEDNPVDVNAVLVDEIPLSRAAH